ncbi:unnamed protein product [Effrenium voratum]|nr:unnamed protein product [Effrenium voratum]
MTLAIHALCWAGAWAAQSSPFTASVQVVADEDARGSVVVLTVANAADGPAVAGWRLCFTWLKATVLVHPSAVSRSGSYVCLPEEPLLAPGATRALALQLGAPAMRHASDLPKGLHLVVGDSVHDVALAAPAEGQVRFTGAPGLAFAGIPQPREVALATGDGFALQGLHAPLEVEVASPLARDAAELLGEWLQRWPPGAPLATSAGSGSARRLLRLAEVAGIEEEGYELYIQAEVREVVSYAKRLGITVVPEVDVPGHCYAAIRALPELLGNTLRKSRARSVQGFERNVLNPAVEATYVFLETVFSEVLELFEGPIHVGMDEVPRGAWSADPVEEERLLAQLASWLQQFLQNRSVLAWQEAFSGQSGIAPDAAQRPAALAWKEDERFAVHAANGGLDVVLCPAHFLYLDIVQSLDFDERGLYWAAPVLPLHRVYGYEPLERLRRLGLAKQAEQRVLGVQANLWTETVDSEERAQEMLFPRLLAVAELAWSAPQAKVWENFKWKLAPSLLWLSQDANLSRWGKSCGVVAGDDFMRAACG